MNEMNSTVTIQKLCSPEQLKIVEQLAWKIFPETYKTLLSAEQIPYMMHMMYDQAVLQKEFSNGMSFALICDSENPIGYITWHALEEDGKSGLKLEKLYLDFAYHGRSIGNMALRYMIETAEKAGVSFVALNVNKDNLRAQKAYTRAGFRRWRSEKNPIGNGFYMDDYVMRYDTGAKE